MEWSILLEYGWVLILLIILEGLLSADNALVLAVMVKNLPSDKRRKALFYGLAGAFVFRFAALFIISFLSNVWQVQAIGALYLLFISGNHIFRKVVLKKHGETENKEKEKAKKANPASFWGTVLKVELADIAFAIDSILAAVALALTLPNTNLPQIGGMDGGKFLVVLTGGLAGLIIMRFAADLFVRLLIARPGLEIAAFMIVGWVGIKLVIYTLAHPDLAIIPESFESSLEWKITFYVVLILIALGGWFFSKEKKKGEATT